MKLARHFNSCDMCLISVKWCFLQVWFDGTTVHHTCSCPTNGAPHAKQRECAVAAVVVEFHVALQASKAPLHSSHCLDAKE